MRLCVPLGALLGVAACQVDAPQGPRSHGTATSSAAVSAAPSAPAATSPGRLGLHGDALPPVVQAGITADGATVVVQRSDESIEAWDVRTEQRVGQVAKGKLASPAAAAEDVPRATLGALTLTVPELRPVAVPATKPAFQRDGNTLVWEALDDRSKRALAHFAKQHHATLTEDGTRLTLKSEAEIAADARGDVIGIDDELLRLSSGGSHRWAPWTTGHSGMGWEMGGTVYLELGPSPERAVVTSWAPQGPNIGVGESRLVDTRSFKTLGSIGATCQGGEIVWSPTARWVGITHCASGQLHLSEGTTGRRVGTLPELRADAWTADEERLVGVNRQGQAVVVDVARGDTLFVVPGSHKRDRPLRSIDVFFSADGRRLVRLAEGGVDVWDLASAAFKHHALPELAESLSTDVTRDRVVIATVDRDGAFWSGARVLELSLQPELGPPSSGPRCRSADFRAQVDDDPPRLVGSSAPAVRLRVTGTVQRCAFSADGTLLALGLSDGSVGVFAGPAATTPAPGTLLRNLREPALKGAELRSLAFRPGTHTLAALGYRESMTTPYTLATLDADGSGPSRHAEPGPVGEGLVWTSDGLTLLCAASSNVSIFDPELSPLDGLPGPSELPPGTIARLAADGRDLAGLTRRLALLGEGHHAALDPSARFAVDEAGERLRLVRLADGAKLELWPRRVAKRSGALVLAEDGSFEVFGDIGPLLERDGQPLEGAERARLERPGLLRAFLAR